MIGTYSMDGDTRHVIYVDKPHSSSGTSKYQKKRKIIIFVSKIVGNPMTR